MKIVKNKNIYILTAIKKNCKLAIYSWKCGKKECELLFLTGKRGIKECEFGQYLHSLTPAFFLRHSFAIFSALKVNGCRGLCSAECFNVLFSNNEALS